MLCGEGYDEGLHPDKVDPTVTLNAVGQELTQILVANLLESAGFRLG